jgi:hypothetical protein
VKSHFLYWLLLLNLLFVAHAYGSGTYQWSEDRKKALVWNNDPQPGDVANWSGGRDENGYATGSGTLNWSRLARGFATGSNIALSRKKTPISSYSGTMVHGKFSGEVTTVDHGKSYHAKFVDGQRKGMWQRGTLIAKAEAAEPTEAAKKSEATSPEKSAAGANAATETENLAQENAEAPAADEPEAPAAGPNGSPVKPKPEIRASESGDATSDKPATPLLAQASTDQTDDTTPRTPATRKAALAPGAVRAFDRPATAAAKNPEPAKKAARPKSEKSEKSSPAAPSQPAELQNDFSEQAPSGAPSVEPEKIEPPKLKTEKAVPEKPRPAAKESPVDNSIRSLVGPPSSLRTNPTTTAPATSTTAPSAPATAPAEPSPPATPKLTAVEAMDIADIEARTRGYDLGDYQLPKAEYNSATDSWSVAYVARGSGESKKLSVSVQDKSGKAEIKK